MTMRERTLSTTRPWTGSRIGVRIDEVPVSYHARIGRSKVTGTVRGTVRTSRDLVRVMRCT